MQRPISALEKQKNDKPELMPNVKKVYDTLKVPYYVARGNHDRVTQESWLQLWKQPEDFAFVSKEKHGIILLNCSNETGKYLCANVEYAKSKLEEFKTLPQVFISVLNYWIRSLLIPM